MYGTNGASAPVAVLGLLSLLPEPRPKGFPRSSPITSHLPRTEVARNVSCGVASRRLASSTPLAVTTSRQRPSGTIEALRHRALQSTLGCTGALGVVRRKDGRGRV